MFYLSACYKMISGRGNVRSNARSEGMLCISDLLGKFRKLQNLGKATASSVDAEWGRGLVLG